MKIYFDKFTFNVDDVWFCVTRKVEYASGEFVLDEKAAKEIDSLIDKDMSSIVITKESCPILSDRLNRIVDSVSKLSIEVYGFALNHGNKKEPDNKDVLGAQ